HAGMERGRAPVRARRAATPHLCGRARRPRVGVCGLDRATIVPDDADRRGRTPPRRAGSSQGDYGPPRVPLAHLGLAHGLVARHARLRAPRGWMPMTNLVALPKAGKIGPIRREIIFEPLPNEAVP